MNYPRTLMVSRTALFALFAFVFGTVSAQVANPAPAAAKPVDETIVLTPFTVDATRDVGFVAASALAGGRLATDLKDTPVAYSVLTREFIDALNLTNVVAASTWTVNTSYAMDDGRSNQFGDAGFYTRTNFRGVASSQPQINFFPAYYDYDSYNVQRYDFARGPNSVLFGSGSNGGTANALYKDAQTNKASHELQVRLGSFNNYRTTLDVNQPLTKQLAVRGNSPQQAGLLGRIACLYGAFILLLVLIPNTLTDRLGIFACALIPLGVGLGLRSYARRATARVSARASVGDTLSP